MKSISFLLGALLLLLICSVAQAQGALPKPATKMTAEGLLQAEFLFHGECFHLLTKAGNLTLEIFTEAEGKSGNAVKTWSLQ